MTSKDNEISFDNALARLADGLLSDKKYNVGTFREFLVNIWSKSYENPEYFDAWHVQLIAEDVEECLATGLNYVCVLPRFHFKCFSEDYWTQFVSREYPTVYNPQTQKVEVGEFVTTDNGVKHVSKITTEFGQIIEVTDEHPFLTFEQGWVEAKDLTTDMHVGVPRNIPEGNQHEPLLAEFIGYLIGDGHISSGCCVFTQAEDSPLLDHVANLAKQLGYGVTYSLSKRTDISFTGGIREKLRELGLYGKTSQTKFVPEFVMHGDLETTQAFLWALFLCDGHWREGKNEGQVQYVTISETLARDVQYLLRRLGIRSRLYEFEYNENVKAKTDTFFHVIFLDPNRMSPGVEDLYPRSWKTKYPLKHGEEFKLRRQGIRIDNRYRPTRKKLERVAEALGMEELQKAVDSDVAWEQIRSIESLGEQPTVAVESTPHHTLTLGGMITHNSTVLGHAFSVWRLLTSPRDCAVLYLSYSDGMAQYHISEINKTVKRNPILMSWLANKSPKADFSFRYSINNKNADILHGGLFSFKRGMHVNGALIADDILRDPENPLNMGQINKVEEHFMTESLFIPLKGVPVIVLGTPMMPGDILSKLQDDSRFKSRVLPALDPVPGRRVLMPELYNEEWLLEQQRARPRSFASEFMLIPHFSTESYFEEEDITKNEDILLVNASPHVPFPSEEDDQFFAGFDVGKKRHPSHLVIFRRRGDIIEQVHSSFLDGWNYADQIEYLNSVADNFDLNKGYVDNTRGELEERGLASVWKPMSFTTKSKNTMAQIFETYIHSGNLRLIRDERQKQQILSVNNDLKAPDTPLGHGDAFFSMAMALSAAYETTIYKIQMLGNLHDWLESIEQGEEEEQNKKMPGRGMPNLVFKPEISVVALDTAPNSNCQELVCNPSFWVPENKLCIYCGYRG